MPGCANARRGGPSKERRLSQWIGTKCGYMVRTAAAVCLRIVDMAVQALENPRCDRCCMSHSLVTQRDFPTYCTKPGTETQRSFTSLLLRFHILLAILVSRRCMPGCYVGPHNTRSRCASFHSVETREALHALALQCVGGRLSTCSSWPLG
jgi:hypothetical protein